MEGDPRYHPLLDWGGEKEIEALAAAGVVAPAAEANPALGLRGIRKLLRHPDLLETQFTAILRAAAAGAVRVLLPMVTNVSEIRDARAIYLRARVRAAGPGRDPARHAPPAGHHGRGSRPRPWRLTASPPMPISSRSAATT